MPVHTLKNVALHSVAAAVPGAVRDQDYFAELFGRKEVERIAKGTGIASIREATSLNTSQLMLAACTKLMASAGIAPSDIDAVISVTQTPDNWSPGLGFTLQHELGLSRDCFVLDLSAGCTGYINGLMQAAALVGSGIRSNVLLCTGDVTTKLISPADRNVRLLFGDAASASLVTKGTGDFRFVVGSDGSGRNALKTAINYRAEADASDAAQLGRLHMDGTAVMNYALSNVPPSVKSLMNGTGLEPDEVDLFVMHQANGFMLEYIRRMIGIPVEKTPIDLDGFGNTSSTSIPLVLSRSAVVGSAQSSKTILCGFGAGFSWGAVSLDLSTTIGVSPVIV